MEWPKDIEDMIWEFYRSSAQFSYLKAKMKKGIWAAVHTDINTVVDKDCALFNLRNSNCVFVDNFESYDYNHEQQQIVVVDLYIHVYWLWDHPFVAEVCARNFGEVGCKKLDLNVHA